MKYNGKELIEIIPENWDGRSREMLVWDDSGNLHKRIVIGYFDNHWVAIYDDWKHCAEIPSEELEKGPELDVVLKRELMEHAKSLDEICKLKEEIKKLNDKVAELNLVLEHRTDFYEKINKTLESIYLDQEKELVELRKKTCR